MKTLCIKFFLLITLLIINGSNTFAQASRDSINLDSLINVYKNNRSIPGIATMIVKEGSTIWSKNYGYKNLQEQLPVDDSTLFLAASVSKTIMATAVMQLWEKGLLDLDNNINTYLPGGFSIINPYHPDDSITVKMLMNHTSSFNDNWEYAPFLQTCGDSPIRLDTFLINYFMPGGMYYDNTNFYNYKPGQIYNYSNTAACLLALMVENLSGKSFSTYCRDSIFIPLDMNSSYWFLEGLDTNRIAIPYQYGGIPVCHQGSPIYPVSRLRTNKLDMMNFLKMYMNDGLYNGIRLLESTTIDYMLSDHLGYHPENEIEQGLIWFKFLPFIDNIWGHDGLATGCATYIGYNPEENYGFLWFQNYADNYTRVGLFPILTHLNNYAKDPTGIYELNSFISFELAQNYPNPFNPSTMIEYSVPSISSVTIKVFDILGNELAILVNEEKSAGTYQLKWDAPSIPSGLYFYQMKAGVFIETKKMILLK